MSGKGKISQYHKEVFEFAEWSGIMEMLTPREKRIARQRLKNVTVSKLAIEFDVCGGRIRQIEDKAARKTIYFGITMRTILRDIELKIKAPR